MIEYNTRAFPKNTDGAYVNRATAARQPLSIGPELTAMQMPARTRTTRQYVATPHQLNFGATLKTPMRVISPIKAFTSESAGLVNLCSMTAEPRTTNRRAF